MLLIAAAMVSMSPFQPLWESNCHNPGKWCIPHRVRDGITIHQGLMRFIGDGINLATSASHSLFCSQLREGAAMPQQIGGDCYSQGYNSSTCNGVEIGGFVDEKLSSFFHINSKIHTICLNKNQFNVVKSVGTIRCKNLTVDDLQQYTFYFYVLRSISIVLFRRFRVWFSSFGMPSGSVYVLLLSEPGKLR